MKTFVTAISTAVLLATLAVVPASAQTARTSRSAPILHVHDDYSSCFFDLHPELTEAEFKEFAGELGSVLRFRQLSDTTTLGKGRVDISLQYTRSPIDDSKGAWNNTMSHPTADHPLGNTLEIPRLVARVGVSDSVDMGAWGGFDPRANYWLAGIDSKILLMRQGPGRPVSLSIRPSVTSLFGPSELWAGNASIDVSAGRTFGAFSPYIGVATGASLAVEQSDDVNLDPAWADGSVVYAGISYGWRGLQVTAEVEKGTLTSVGFRIGKRF